MIKKKNLDQLRYITLYTGVAYRFMAVVRKKKQFD